jgi:hypothetical protein
MDLNRCAWLEQMPRGNDERNGGVISLPAYWQRFPKFYGTDLSYWYQPKGMAVTVDGLKARLSILSEFDGQPWRDSQSAYVRRLNEEGISGAENDWGDGGGAPFARMLKQVLVVLGLAWVDGNDRVEITEAGERFLKTNDPDQFLAIQSMRYQFWNPSVGGPTHTDVRLHPVPFLIRLLGSVEGFSITKTEYLLFVAKAKKISDVDACADLIEKFRKLSPEERRVIVDRCDAYNIAGPRRRSILNTISLNRTYAYKMWCLCPAIDATVDGGMTLKPQKIRGEYRKFMDEYASDSAYVEFVSEKEFLSYMGVPDLMPTKETALEAYVSRGDIMSAAKIKKELGSSKEEVNSFKKMLLDEKTLENNIEKNIDFIGDRIKCNLQLVGRQYQTTVGPIDLLAFDTKKNRYVVIELKKGRSADKVFGQLSRYMGWVRKHLADGHDVVGVIVAGRIDDKLRAAREAHAHTEVYLLEFESKMRIKAV